MHLDFSRKHRQTIVTAYMRAWYGAHDRVLLLKLSLPQQLNPRSKDRPGQLLEDFLVWRPGPCLGKRYIK
jgi:hypothetical protein